MSRHQRNQPNALDESFDALSHQHRREILTRLHARDPRDGLELERLVENEVFDDDTINLVHTHLPKLADAGFVDWDEERDVVTRGPRFHQIDPLVDLLLIHRDDLPTNWP